MSLLAISMARQVDKVSWYAATHGFDHSCLLRPALTACLLTHPEQQSDNASHFGSIHPSHLNETHLDTRKVVNVVITKSFNAAPDEVQTQAMEVIHSLPSGNRLTHQAFPSSFVVAASSVVLPCT